MGDPKKQKKKYSTPSHPWQKERIEAEKVLLREYGLRNKKEIWKMDAVLKDFAQQAKNLISLKSEQAEKEKKQLISRAQRLGMIGDTADLNTLLSLNIKDVLNRRLQTIVYKKELAKSMGQARQFIVHKHIVVAGKKITQPSYIVLLEDEAKVSFSANASLSSPDHPERMKEMVKGAK